MKIFPAIDLKNGEVVRLVEGDYNNKKTYSTNPMEVLDFFIEEGGENLHPVKSKGYNGHAPKGHEMMATSP